MKQTNSNTRMPGFCSVRSFRQRRTLPVLLLLCVLFIPLYAFTPAPAPAPAHISMLAPKIAFVKKIWDKAPHNAFTDITHFKDKWYCVFREANSHRYNDGFGTIRVIASTDMDSWTSVKVIKDKNFDLRDPKLTVTPDGNLMLLYTGIRITDTLGTQHFESKVIFTKNGKRWSHPQDLSIKNQMVWRVIWHKNIAYTVSWHKDSGVNLYRSKDGIRYEHVCKLPLKGFPNETSLLFLKNDRLLAIVRREGDTRNAFIGESTPPYTHWKFDESWVYACGPNAVLLPDSSIMACYRRYDNSRPKLCLSRINRLILSELMELPAGGDCGYAGMYMHENALWMSYYSSHEGKSSIYLAKIIFQDAGTPR